MGVLVRSRGKLRTQRCGGIGKEYREVKDTEVSRYL